MAGLRVNDAVKYHLNSCHMLTDKSCDRIRLSIPSVAVSGYCTCAKQYYNKLLSNVPAATEQTTVYQPAPLRPPDVPDCEAEDPRLLLSSSAQSAFGTTKRATATNDPPMNILCADFFEASRIERNKSISILRIMFSTSASWDPVWTGSTTRRNPN
jgi:hypothetical protein